jgi:hypothetical protein
MPNQTPYSAEIRYGSMPVGVFIGANPPSVDGVYEYMPYRGFGHFEMWQEIERSGFARCAYSNGEQEVAFNVQDAGTYGVLKLSSFCVRPVSE